ncbi:MAG: NF038122 family metalloprotease, partial [Caulobacterales bacterium]
MTLPTEAVTLAGSGLVFLNNYSAGVSDAYRGAILAAENLLQGDFTNPVTVSVDFGFSSLGKTFSAQNQFDTVSVSYATLTAALRAHATTADDVLAVNGLPASDPSNGVGFDIPTAQAHMLGLAAQSNNIDDSVTLNSDLNFTFGQDAIGAIEHEITEGVFGRTASLGFDGPKWNPLDLFRFTASGQRDFTGGSDGVATYFGIDGAHVSNLALHNAISAAGVSDGFDLGDWDHTFGDAFGPGGPGAPGSLSATDLQVLDVLGWTPRSSGGPFVPAPDEFASSLTDAAHPFGQLAVGGSATGVLQQAGDHDWFAVQLQAGRTYTISETGHAGGGGSLADPFLRVHDALGNLAASNDDIVSGINPDSRLVFTAPAGGTYYVDAGSFADGYAGSYRVDVSPSSTAGSPTGGQVLVGALGGDTIQAPDTNDTISGGSGGSNYLRGNGGDDSITGGGQFDDINGNMGNDTLHGGAGDDWVVGGKGDDLVFGDDGDDIVLGNLGNDTLDGGNGNDVVRGGQGDDVLVGGAGNDFISGDRGNATESGGPGADIFHSSQDAGVDKVLDFHLAEGDRVMLDPGTTYTVS